MDDLISKKELIREILDVYEHEYPTASGDFDKFVTLVIPNIINRAPTTDAEPIRYGYWVDKPSGRYGQQQSWCSCCGERSGIGGIKSNRHKSHCPNCGAKMKEIINELCCSGT